MAAAKLTDALRGQILALSAPPEELSVRAIAERLGVGKTIVADVVAASKGKAVKPRSARKVTPRPRATRQPSPSRATVGAAAVPPTPSKPAYAPPTVVGFIPAPPPATLAADPLVDLQAYAAEVRGRQSALPAGSAEYRALGAEFRKTTSDMERIRGARKLPPTEAERTSAARPRAAEVLGKIRSGVRAWAQREVETTRCCRCTQTIPPELVLRRRVEAGMDDVVVPGAS